jgi:hypothetical protein
MARERHLTARAEFTFNPAGHHLQTDTRGQFAT